MSISAPSVIAQEVRAAIEQNSASEEMETIEITGVRGSLESALLSKRDAPSIIDAISAKDMDSLPALDLGEALQAIPGIQLNTDDGSRNSEINLRGLSGGFVKTTAEGQSFATPSRSAGNVGGSNPFGSFEASVFDGVNVVKATTADMQEGGIAGSVDKKLQRALGKKDGKYSLNFGSRYEELSESWDNEIKISATKHLIKDKLAVAFKVAASEQNFRRDTANFTQYTSLNTVENNAIHDTGFISAEDLNAYKAQHGINDPLAIVKVIGKAGQVTENSRGDRLSATGNIEFQATESLKIGANFLFTRRDLGDSNMEDVQYSIGRDDDKGRLDTQKVTPIGAPIRLSDNANPAYNPAIHHPDLATIPVYAVTHAQMTNVSWTPSNRLSSQKEEAKGIFLYADYITDDWVIDGTVSKSESLNEFHMSGLDLRHQNKTNKQYTDLDSSDRLYYAATGLNAEINTGNGDLSNAFATLTGFDNWNYSDVNGVLAQVDPETGEPLYDLGENAWKRGANGWKSVPLTSFGSTLDPKINPLVESHFPAGYFPAAPAELTAEQEAALTPEEAEARAAQLKEREDALAKFGGKSLDYYVNGRVQRPEREYESGELNFERYTDIGNDLFRISSIKFGGRHSREILDTYDVRVGGGAMNLSQINGDVLYKDQLSSDGQTVYFNGDYPGHYGSSDGWKVLDSRNLATLVQQDMVAYDEDGNIIEDVAIADPTGFAVKLKTGDPETDGEAGLNENYRFNFSADQVINAVYLMNMYEGEIAGMSYTGNFGVRYIETTNDVIGQGFDDEEKPIAVLTETDYDHTLPSFNIAVDLTDDVVFRTAYSKGLVRPNLLAQTPSPVNTNTRTRVRLENSKAEVLPYTSENFDLSLAWYNREGSALSVGIFTKEIQGQILTQTICPVGDHEKYNVGELELIQDGSSNGKCQEVGDFDPGNGEDIVSNRTVTIKETFNSNIPIKVTGYELAVQQKLDFLPYPWNGFGGVFNFTKVDLDEGGGQPMTRIAPYSYNLIGYYENDGASIRLAYNWQDEKLLSAGGTTSFLGSDARTQTAGGRLDMSTSYRFGKGIKVNFKAINLNNRQEYEYIGGNEDAINRIRFAGRTYVVSLSYNF
ncbi:TonB-dependent receptor domain-containing protein [Algibacillus agarilyticus]|uniref:TonB-dependent receptor domain-containing protein n=1 Tax=Algibacillus agarilyticus TaxID=2234133 RepID=UPI001E4E60A4|nr:TonB-dependent receptor [Algibacillus agarilyticus]